MIEKSGVSFAGRGWHNGSGRGLHQLQIPRCSKVITLAELVPIRDVPKRLPPRSTGRPIHISAVYRWIASGRLEALKIGGTTYTSEAALVRFAQQLNPNVPTRTIESPNQRERRQATTARRVAEALGLRHEPTNETHRQGGAR